MVKQNKTLYIISLIFLSSISLLTTNLYSEGYSAVPFKLKQSNKNTQAVDPLNYSKVSNQRDDIEWQEMPFFLIGVKGGIQFSTGTLSGTVSNNGWVIAFPAILFFECRIEKHFSFELDLEYSMKGTKFNIFTGSVSTTGTAKVKYLTTIPYFKIFPLEEYLFIGFGPSFHVMLSDSVTFDSILPPGQSPFSKSFAVGLVTGIGVQFQLEPIIIIVEGRFHLGLSEILDQTKVTNASLFFRDLQLLTGLAYQF